MLAALVWEGMLVPSRALIGGAVIFVSTAILIAPFAVAIAEAREAPRRSAPMPEAAGTAPGSAPGLGPAATGLRLAALRLARLWREEVETAKARLAAAEAILDGDGPTDSHDQQQLVHSDAQAAALVGAEPGPRDLAAALRNTAVLAAADAVLRGEPARASNSP